MVLLRYAYCLSIICACDKCIYKGRIRWGWFESGLILQLFSYLHINTFIPQTLNLRAKFKYLLFGEVPFLPSTLLIHRALTLSQTSEPDDRHAFIFIHCSNICFCLWVSSLDPISHTHSCHLRQPCVYSNVPWLTSSVLRVAILLPSLLPSLFDHALWLCLRDVRFLFDFESFV